MRIFSYLFISFGLFFISNNSFGQQNNFPKKLNATKVTNSSSKAKSIPSSTENTKNIDFYQEELNAYNNGILMLEEKIKYLKSQDQNTLDTKLKNSIPTMEETLKKWKKERAELIKNHSSN